MGMRCWVRVGLVGFLCAIVGCGPRARVASARSAGEVEPQEPWADAFSTEATPGLIAGGAADDALRSALAESCQAAALAPDGRLAQLAEALARDSASSGRTPDAAQVAYQARRLGLLEPTPQLWLGNASNTAAVVPALRDAVQSAARSGGVTHCGGAAIQGGYGVVVVVAFVRRLLTLDTPIPSALQSPASLSLSGRLAPGYTRPTLATTDPHGKVERVELGAGAKVERQVQLPEPGHYTLELLATGPEGVTVVAVFPVAAGVAIDRTRPDSGSREAERDADAVVARLTELVARERKQRGLPALELSTTLAQVALGHSQDMHEHHFVAHTSRSTGEANDRVARAGVRTTLLLENIGRGYNADEIHAGLMESPGHRGNVLHPDVRVLGVGVVAEGEGDRVAFLATELFARLARPVDWPSAQRDLFQAIAAQRKAHGQGAIALDPTLSRTAQLAVERALSRPEASEQATLDEALRSVRALPRGASVLSAALVKAEDLEQVAGSAELLDPRIIAVGLGLAPLPAGASHALEAVLLLALRQ
jgi:uncharacterized protein YkwD